MKRRKILIRFDDLCPAMDYEQWNKAMKILTQYSIKPLIGIVPECKDKELMIEEEHKDFWDYIVRLQLEGFTVAMHGFQHTYDKKQRGITNRGYDTEFAGHPYEIQFQKIKQGKEKLLSLGIHTDIFFAPSHSYDKNTLSALVDNGFRYMLDGKSKKPINRNGLICVSVRGGGIPKIHRTGYYTVVIHTNTWAKKNSIGYERFLKFCSLYHNDIVDYSTYIERKCGNICIQSIDEKLFLLWERFVQANLSLFYRKWIKNWIRKLK